MLNNLLPILYLCSLLASGQAITNCRLPTEDNPVSVCSYCSQSHAGIRWAVHQSSIDNYPYGVYTMDVHFHCSNAENSITQDVCFNGDLFPGFMFLSNPTAWRWHILGHKLSIGTECQFTAIIDNGYRRKILELSSSCVIGDMEDQVMPATCTESNQQGCSCHCSDGFVTDNEIVSILTCINTDECSKGTHRCSDVNNCVDTEGSYYCKGEPSPTATGKAVPTPTSTVAAPMYTTTIPQVTDMGWTAGMVALTPSITPKSFSEPVCTTTTSTVTICNTTTSTITQCFSRSV